jgi:antitoxin HicB
MKHKKTGSSFDSFLEEQDLLSEVEARVTKRMFLEQLEKAMKQSHVNRSTLRKKLGSPTTVSRLFDEKNTGTAILTLARVAEFVGKEIQIQLVDRPRRKSREAAV